MANVLKREKEEQIRALGRLGWSLRRIEEATGVRRETIARCLRRVGIGVRPPRGRAFGEQAKAASQASPDSESISKAASQVTPDLERTSRPASRPMASACEPHRDLISQALDQARNAKAIWQDLVDDQGFDGGYQSVKRFVRKLRGSVVHEGHPTITTAPGEEAQVDYGEGPMVRDPHSGKYRRTRLFALTLGWSRKAVWILAFKSSSKIWCELHEQAFRRLGGCPRVFILDNLKEGVLQPDVCDPALNPLYRDMLAHYGAVALPARVRHPDRKGKVERSVGFAQGTPLKGLRFESLEEAQSYLDRWTDRWADTRIHGTTKRQVAAMFAEERPLLLTLPAEPFRYYQYGTRTAHLDGCVEVEAAYYGVPPGLIGRELAVQWDALRVRILDPSSGMLLREHAKKPRGWRTVHPSDQPVRTPLGTLKLLSRARTAGEAIGKLCEQIHSRQGEAGVRRILGVLALVKKQGVSSVEVASKAALELGLPDYRFVKKWLERHPSPPLSLRQVDPLIRELGQYRDLVSKLTSTTETA